MIRILIQTILNSIYSINALVFIIISFIIFIFQKFASELVNTSDEQLPTAVRALEVQIIWIYSHYFRLQPSLELFVLLILVPAVLIYLQQLKLVSSLWASNLSIMVNCLLNCCEHYILLFAPKMTPALRKPVNWDTMLVFQMHLKNYMRLSLLNSLNLFFNLVFHFKPIYLFEFVIISQFPFLDDARSRISLVFYGFVPRLCKWSWCTKNAHFVRVFLFFSTVYNFSFPPSSANAKINTTFNNNKIINNSFNRWPLTNCNIHSTILRDRLIFGRFYFRYIPLILKHNYICKYHICSVAFKKESITDFLTIFVFSKISTLFHAIKKGVDNHNTGKKKCNLYFLRKVDGMCAPWSGLRDTHFWRLITYYPFNVVGRRTFF
uniref:Uncharacterized protein n=1 Tax=Heterorhabditis bacteriophora TaxID=37862 RepID=A0A1I7WEA0_HETBA